MIEIEASIRSRLLLMSAVTAIVGTGSDARIRPDKLWQKDDLSSGPAIVIKVNSESEEENTDLNCEGGLVNADVSIICVAEERADARALARAVKNNGSIPSTGLSHSEWAIEGARNVQSCCYINTILGFFPYSDNSDKGFYFAESHYTVLYDDPV